MTAKELRGMGLTWEEAKVAAASTEKNSVKCDPVRPHARGSMKVKVNAYILATSGKKTLQRCSESNVQTERFSVGA